MCGGPPLVAVVVGCWAMLVGRSSLSVDVCAVPTVAECRSALAVCWCLWSADAHRLLVGARRWLADDGLLDCCVCVVLA